MKILTTVSLIAIIFGCTNPTNLTINKGSTTPVPSDIKSHKRSLISKINSYLDSIYSFEIDIKVNQSGLVSMNLYRTTRISGKPYDFDNQEVIVFNIKDVTFSGYSKSEDGFGKNHFNIKCNIEQCFVYMSANRHDNTLDVSNFSNHFMLSLKKEEALQLAKLFEKLQGLF